MVPKPNDSLSVLSTCFRAVLFRMVPKQAIVAMDEKDGFRAVLFRMVPKPLYDVS